MIGRSKLSVAVAPVWIGLMSLSFGAARAGGAEIDLRGHVAAATRVEQAPGGALRVTFLQAEWPSIRFVPPGQKPWDWRRAGSLVITLKNPGDQPIEPGIRVDDDPAADGVVHCRTAIVKLGPGESRTFRVLLAKDDPMAFGMRALPAPAGMHGVQANGSGPFDPGHVVMFQVFLHGPKSPRVLEIHAARPGEPVPIEAIVDRFGQYARGQWPGKVISEADLIARHRAEAADFRTHPAPADRDRFGGWRNGPKQEATGFFRTAQVDGRWWLVDPDGALFVSLGVDVVTPWDATIITGRESMFTGLPPKDDPLARHFGHFEGIHSGPVRSGTTFNFYGANLERAYGPDAMARWRKTSIDRLRSWGFNTIGNWSDHGLYRNGRIPYVATVTVDGRHARVPSGSDYWGKMHDPFDPAFAASVRDGLRDVVRRVKGDPWCLGIFVDNELSWGGFGGEEGRYGLALGALSLGAAESPAKRTFLDRLRKEYGEIDRLSAAWSMKIPSWSALDAGWKPDVPAARWTTRFKADLSGFVKELAQAYFKTVRAELKAQDKEHLYLGCRFAWRNEDAVAASAETCDVVSFNIYDRRVDPTKWGFLTGLNRPAIIGEFHVGALDRGMFHTGLVSAASQAERAQIYRDYVASVLDNPALVGCHWFQYVDEPLTGRSYDGENYNIGFVTATDTPYPELVAAARAIHREAYTRRAGKSVAPPPGEPSSR